MKPIHFFQGRTYKNQVIVIICLLAMSRVLLAVIVDLVLPEIHLSEVMTDVGILFLFTGLFVVSFYRRTISSFHPVLGFIIILLIAHNFMQFGGVMGSSRFTYYGGLFFIGMAYSNRNMYLMIGAQFVLLIIMLAMQIVEHPLQQYVFVRDATGNIDFVFALFSVTVMSSFLRETTKIEFLKLGELSKELFGHVKKSRKQNSSLIEHGDALLKAQRQLAMDVQTRTAKIQTQNTAIEQFIRYNSQALNEPQEKLTQVVKSLDGDDTLHQLLRISCNELNEVMNKIQLTISSDQDLNRENIKPS